MIKLKANILTNIKSRTFEFVVDDINEKELYHILKDEIEWAILDDGEWIESAYIEDKDGKIIMTEDDNGEFHLC